MRVVSTAVARQFAVFRSGASSLLTVSVAVLKVKCGFPKILHVWLYLTLKMKEHFLIFFPRRRSTILRNCVICNITQMHWFVFIPRL